MEDSYVVHLPNTIFKDLSLWFCGMAECKPGHRFGPGLRPNYVIHFVLSGKGVYQVGDRQYELQKGQGFLIVPETLISYCADEKDPWTYMWIGFSGNMAEQYLSDIGLHVEHPVFQCGQMEELKKLVLKMLKYHNFSVAEQYQLQSLLYQFFSVLAKGVEVDLVGQNSRESIYVRESVNFIRKNYFRGINVTDIAGHICVNRSYLYKLFQESFQMSPKEFLTQFRISRARELLSWSELSVESVAWSCGYHDPLVFAKVFKKTTGMPPSAYRKMHQKKMKEQTIEKGTGIGKLMEEEALEERM